METADVNTPQEPMFRLCEGGCGRLVPTKNGRKHCTDHCRLQAWARRQVAPSQRRIEFAPTASKIQTKRVNRCRRIMDLLSTGPVVTWQLWQAGGTGMSGRLKELRDELRPFGWDIFCEEHEDGATYTLGVIR